MDEYLIKEIFEPLEMMDSYFYLPAEKASRLVTLYSNNSINGSLYVCKNVSNQTFPVAGAKTYFQAGRELWVQSAIMAIFAKCY